MTKKVYEFKTGDGKFNFRMLDKVDGRVCSITGAYPMYTNNRKLTRKETEKHCIEIAISNGWIKG